MLPRMHGYRGRKRRRITVKVLIPKPKKGISLTDYWIFKVQDEAGGIFARRGIDLFEHRINEGFWSIRDYNENGKLNSKVSSLKKGDLAVFYLIDKEDSCFLGSCVLDSDCLRLDAEQTKKLVHREYLDSNQGVFLKSMTRWARSLPVNCLRGKAVNGGNFSSYFQGSFKRLKHPQDFHTIIREHKLMLKKNP